MSYRRVDYIDENKLMQSIISICENVALYDKEKSSFYRAGAYAIMHKYYSLVNELGYIPFEDLPHALYEYLRIERDLAGERCMNLVDKGPWWELHYQEGCFEALNALLDYLRLLLNI